MERKKKFEYYKSIGEKHIDKYYEDFLEDNEVFELRLRALDYPNEKLIQILDFLIDKLNEGTMGSSIEILQPSGSCLMI